MALRTIGLGVETGQQVDLVTFTLGVVGLASHIEQTQKFFHELTESDEPQGWDTQFGNELGILVTHQRSWRELATTTLIGFNADVTRISVARSATCTPTSMPD